MKTSFLPSFHSFFSFFSFFISSKDNNYGFVCLSVPAGLPNHTKKLNERWWWGRESVKWIKWKRLYILWYNWQADTHLFHSHPHPHPLPSPCLFLPANLLFLLSSTFCTTLGKYVAMLCDGNWRRHSSVVINMSGGTLWSSRCLLS